MVVAFLLGSSSCLVRFLCSNLDISDIDYYNCREVVGSLRVHFVHSIVGHCACSALTTSGV
jgi:hypothetical protein